MRIGLDVSAAVHQRAGAARYAAGLATALAGLGTPHDFVGVYAAPGPATPAPHLPGVTPRPLRGSVRRLRLRLLLAHLTGRPAGAPLADLDLFHGCDFVAPPLGAVPTVVSVHDLSFVHLPECHTPLNRWYLRLAVPRAARAAAAVLVPSASAARDLRQWLGLPEDRVAVVPPGVDARFRPAGDPAALRALRERLGLPRRYLLFVGTREPRKNLGTLLAAYRALRAGGAGCGLVVAGAPGWRVRALERELGALAAAGEVVLPGFVAEDDLPGLYAGAEALVLPSRAEGFGLPVLEAMACGTPVVAARAPGLAEAAGDAGLLVEPGDAEGLARALRAVLEQPALRAGLTARGLARAAGFGWPATARATLGVYQRVAGTAGRA
jgi:glycosyltransferase involved in cell wall biosynthesis